MKKYDLRRIAQMEQLEKVEEISFGTLSDFPLSLPQLLTTNTESPYVDGQVSFMNEVQRRVEIENLKKIDSSGF